MTDFDRISQQPNMMGGKACIRGMRVTVGNIVGQIGSGQSIAEVLDDYPYLEREDAAGGDQLWLQLREGNAWKTYVFKDDTASLTPIEAGHSDGRFTEILSGITTGDEVLLHPPDTVKDGTPVTKRGK